jgi:hypothetical protein
MAESWDAFTCQRCGKGFVSERRSRPKYCTACALASLQEEHRLGSPSPRHMRIERRGRRLAALKEKMARPRAEGGSGRRRGPSRDRQAAKGSVEGKPRRASQDVAS